jgi:hypothetical protein
MIFKYKESVEDKKGVVEAEDVQLTFKEIEGNLTPKK